jgi:hypothetical protein
MNRLNLASLAALVTVLVATATLCAQQPAEPPPAQEPPPAPEVQPAPQPELPPVELIEATREEIWTLGGQQWDFRDISTAYVPVKGVLNPQTGVVEWTLEIVRELSDGEVGLQENLAGSPFRPTFIDEERIALAEDVPVRVSKITGKVGDRLKMTLRLPEDASVRYVRVGRRTKVGF